MQSRHKLLLSLSGCLGVSFLKDTAPSPTPTDARNKGLLQLIVGWWHLGTGSAVEGSKETAGKVRAGSLVTLSK